MNRIIHLLIFTYIVCSSPVYTEPIKVSIDLSTQRYLGEDSQLNRVKYFNIHTHPFYAVYSYEDIRNLKENYGVSFGRAFNGPFWFFPAKKSLSTPFPSEAQAETLSRGIRDFTETLPTYPLSDRRTVITDHPYEGFHLEMDTKAAAQWAVHYFKHFYSDFNRPKFYEPLNEPFVHAKDYGKDEAAVRLKMSELYRDIGKAFDQSELDVQVIGYASAWPEMELKDFWHWNTRMKLFMDVAGDSLDGFSVHLYDGTNVTGQDNRRSGANADAILDLIETYSMLRWGIVKPHAITEYGDIPKGYGEDYSDIKSAQNHRAYNHILFGLMERQDRLLQSIPFITGKSPWYYKESGKLMAYGWDLWKPDPDHIVDGEVQGYLFTPQLYFYRLWNGVQGERCYATSNNPDLQVQSFVHETTTWVCLNNLSDDTVQAILQTTEFKAKPTASSIRRLNVPPGKAIIYSDQKLETPLSKIELAPYETVILCTEYEHPINFAHKRIVQSHYSPVYLQKIEADRTLTFTFTGLPENASAATLRMSIGRKPNQSKQPIVQVNGNPIEVPDNWPGYEQSSREDFFGAIPIPFSSGFLQTNTTVDITFPDSGGHISSLLLLSETSQPLESKVP